MADLNILDRIVSYKREEIRKNKIDFPSRQLEQQPGFNRTVFSLSECISDPGKTGIIAEFKRKSPSRGVINDRVEVADITAAYTLHGASAISVLTDSVSFGGSAVDLKAARFNSIPILRKDFILDPYQLVESRAIGADAVLLIAACLQPSETRALARAAHDLGLEILLEIHTAEELDHLCDEVDVVGINNRDLKTFTVDIERSIRLSQNLPQDIVRISESGLRNVDILLRLRDEGFHGFLIGEQFMNAPDPAIAFAAFVHELKTKKSCA